MNKLTRALISLAALLPCALANAGAGGYVGVKFLGDKVVIDWDSFASTGASAATTGFSNTADVSVYKQCGPAAFNVTKRASTSGYNLIDTDSLDIDSHTGFNAVGIDTADNADAGFYKSGCDYFVNVDSVTIDSQTVRFTARFSLDPRVVAFGTLSANSDNTSTAKLGTTGLTFDGQYVSNIIWNYTKNERKCITVSDDNTVDLVTFAPNTSSAWSSGDVYKILDDVPCYPVTLPALGPNGGVMVDGFLGGTTTHYLDAQMADNLRQFFKNRSADSTFVLDDIPTSFLSLPNSTRDAVLGGTVESGVSVKCALGLIAAYAAGPWADSGVGNLTSTYKDPNNSATRIVVTRAGDGHSVTINSYTCPP